MEIQYGRNRSSGIEPRFLAPFEVGVDVFPIDFPRCFDWLFNSFPAELKAHSGPGFETRLSAKRLPNCCRNRWHGCLNHRNYWNDILADWNWIWRFPLDDLCRICGQADELIGRFSCCHMGWMSRLDFGCFPVHLCWWFGSVRLLFRMNF